LLLLLHSAARRCWSPVQLGAEGCPPPSSPHCFALLVLSARRSLNMYLNHDSDGKLLLLLPPRNSMAAGSARLAIAA
jgi:hypothetical protein